MRQSITRNFALTENSLQKYRHLDQSVSVGDSMGAKQGDATVPVNGHGSILLGSPGHLNFLSQSAATGTGVLSVHLTLLRPLVRKYCAMVVALVSRGADHLLARSVRTGFSLVYDAPALCT